MKTFFCILAGITGILLFMAAADAATQQWTYSGSNGVYQIMVDGKGGCVVFRITHPPKGDIVWLDKKGNPLYTVGVSNITVGRILTCTPKTLIYTDSREVPAVFQVDAKGTHTRLPAAAGTYNAITTPFPMFTNKATDKKGFFAVNTKTNPLSVTVIRFSNK